jgi:hypothetical protein
MSKKSATKERNLYKHKRVTSSVRVGRVRIDRRILTRIYTRSE